MASLNKTPAGWTIQVFCEDGKRRSIRLEHGLSRKQATVFQSWVEQLSASKRSGLPLDEDCQRWLIKLGDVMHDRVAATGLVEARSTNRLGNIITEYIDSHKGGISAETLRLWRSTEGVLLDYFGADKPIHRLTAEQARAWREWMLQTLAENTARLRTRTAVQMLRSAMKAHRIFDSPFAGLPMVVTPRKDKHFVSIQDTEKILAACEDPNARLYFALARYGGLRCPSEVKGLLWSHVDWNAGRILIHAPKTKRFEGRGERYIPLFKSLEPHLLERFDAAPIGDSLVIPKRVSSTYLKKVVKKCEIPVWKDFFKSCRSSRQGELLEKHPDFVVAGIMGHSKTTAATFYNQVSPDAFNACAED